MFNYNYIGVNLNPNLFTKTYNGTSGNDVMYGNDLTAILEKYYGGFGDDLFMSSLGADIYYGGSGTDKVTYIHSDAGVRVNLNSGRGSGGDAEGDKYNRIEDINGSGHDDALRGNFADNEIRGGSGDDELWGMSGNDDLRGGYGDDVLRGDEGNDDLWGNSGDDSLYGGIGNDGLHGGLGNDRLSGEEGNDSLHGGRGDDVVFGGAGNDRVNGDAGDDRLVGGSGDDFSYGGSGNDYLMGENGDDTLFGGSGNDRLHGGTGDDDLHGGTGADTFTFYENGSTWDLGSHGNDTILDFDIGSDKISLDGTEISRRADRDPDEGWNDLFGGNNRFMEQDGDNVVIYTDNGYDGSSITLMNIDIEDLSQSDFIF